MLQQLIITFLYSQILLTSNAIDGYRATQTGSVDITQLSCSFNRSFCGWTADLTRLTITDRHCNPPLLSWILPPSGHNFAFARSSTSVTGKRDLLLSPLVYQSGTAQVSFWYIVYDKFSLLSLSTVTPTDYRRQYVWSTSGNSLTWNNTWLPALATICETSEFRLEFELELSRLNSSDSRGIGLSDLIVNSVNRRNTTAELETAVQPDRARGCADMSTWDRSITCRPITAGHSNVFCGWALTNGDGLTTSLGRYHGNQTWIEMSDHVSLSVQPDSQKPLRRSTRGTIQSPTVAPSKPEGVFSFWSKCLDCGTMKVQLVVSDDSMATNVSLATLNEKDLEEWVHRLYSHTTTNFSHQYSGTTFAFNIDFDSARPSQFLLDRVWYSAEPGFEEGESRGSQSDDHPLPRQSLVENSDRNVTGVLKGTNGTLNNSFQISAMSMEAESTCVHLFKFQNPSYKFDLEAGTEYKLVFEAAHSHNVTLYVNLKSVLPDEDTVIESFSFIPITTTGNGTVHGTILNAATGLRSWKTDVRADFRQGINAKTGSIVHTTVMSAGADQFSTELPTGYYTAEVSANGSISTFTTVMAVNASISAGYSIVVFPVVGDNATRIILTWLPVENISFGAYVCVLDSTHHNELSSRNMDNCSSRSETYMKIDNWNNASVEVITVDDKKIGSFRYSVRDYSFVRDEFGGDCVRLLARSKAQVQVIQRDTVIRMYNVPHGNGTLWDVFETREDGSVYGLNRIQYVHWKAFSTANPVTLITETDNLIIAASVCTVVVLVVGASVVLFFRHRRQQRRCANRELKGIRLRDQWDKRPSNGAKHTGNFYSFKMQSFTGEEKLQSLISQYTRLLDTPRSSVKIDYERLLGRGEFGVVYKGLAHNLPTILRGLTIVAVKVLVKSADTDQQMQFAEEYKVMLKAGRHVNIVNILGIVVEGQPMLLIEYCRFGSLLTYLRSRRADKVYSHVDERGTLLPLDVCEMNYQWQIICEKEKRVPESEDMADHMLSTNDLIKFGHQISRGMEYLTSRSIIHRDLAARNILVSDGKVLKISDFGLARHGADSYTVSNVLIALPLLWMPPEAILLRTFSEKSDVWSFGILLWEIFSLGQVPFDQPNVAKLSTNAFGEWLMEGHQMTRPVGAPLSIFNLMRLCWALKKEDRPTFTEIWSLLDVIVSSMNDGGNYLPLEEVNDTFKELDEQILTCLSSQVDVTESEDL